jgi:single-strand DNA-binding protein
MSSLNLNEVILVGRLTADVEVKQTTSGLAVCSFTLAVNRRRSSDNAQQTADFISCTAWRGTAEFIGKYFKKGSALCIKGSIQTRSWQDQQGQKRYATEVIVDEAMFVDSKSDASPQNQPVPAAYVPDVYTQPPVAQAAPAAPQFSSQNDDNLPF